MRIALSIILGFLITINISQAQNLESKIEDKWSFEKINDPVLNEGRAKEGKLNSVDHKRVTFSNGMARINSLQGGLVQLKSSVFEDKNYTVWSRFKFESKELKQLKSRDSLHFAKIGDVDFYLRTAAGANEGLTFAIVGKVNEMPIDPGMSATISAGSWIQLALVKEEFQDKDKLSVYYREEVAEKNKSYWTYIGNCFLKRSKGSKRTVSFGNLHNNSANTANLLLDEVQVYASVLKKEELVDLWPSLGQRNSAFKKLPGVVIDHSAASTGRFIGGSPSIVKLEDGTYLAKADDYGPAVGRSELARIYRSSDKGSTWREISQIEGTTWATLFTHKGAVYLLGTSAGHRLGHVVIMKSLDGGETWTKALDNNSGLLKEDLSYHTAPVPVIVHNKRIWRAVEDEKAGGGWGKTFRAMMMSASVDSDLLDAKSWTFSEPVAYNKDWLNGNFNGILEGNAIVAPSGDIINLLRVDIKNAGGKAAYISYDETGKIPSFDPSKDFIDFPGGSTKFHVLFDSISNRYWALSNAVLEKHSNSEINESLVRNTLVLMKSVDLKKWEIVDTVLYHPDVAKHAFQYPSFLFDGNDIVFVSRTAFDDGVGGAFRQHDSNYFTFHRIRNFRKIKY